MNRVETFENGFSAENGVDVRGRTKKTIICFFFSNFDLQKSWGCWILLLNPEHFVKDFPTNFRAVRVPPWSPNLRKNITFQLGALLSANRPHFSS